MAEAVLIGVDAGTSVIKAVAFDTSGRQIAVASRRNSYASLPNGGVEQDMARTWADTAAVLRELVEGQPGLAARVVGLAVTGQGDGTWLIDADGAPVHDGWLWLDARAGAEARQIAGSDGIATIYETTATGVNVCQMRTHLKWMQAHAPELLNRAATAFHCKDWLYFRLTDVRATDPTEALFTFGDYRTRAYSDEVLRALGLSELRRLLPEIVDGAVTSHPLTPEAAEATGLPAGLPVTLGYVDVICTAMGGGICDPAAMPGLTVLGSTGMHMRYVPDASQVRLNADFSGYTMALPGGAYSQMQTNMAATLNIDWLLGLAVEILGTQGVTRGVGDLLDGIDAAVLAARPGAALYHPYISTAGERGPFAEPLARASLTGLDQTVGWFDILRAVYDGLALASRDCYRAMGPTPGEIRVAGGAARSGALRSILAAALNRPVRNVAQEEAGAVGAVMLAALNQGQFTDIDTATRAWVLPLLQEPLDPNPQLAGVYDGLFDAYLATRQALAPVWATLAEARAT